MNWKVQLFKLFLILQIIEIHHDPLLGRNVTAICNKYSFDTISLRSSGDASTHLLLSGDLYNTISNQSYHTFIDEVANHRINSLSKLSNNMLSITPLLIIVYISSIYVVKHRGIWKSVLLFLLSSINWCQSSPTTAPTPSCLTIYVNVSNPDNINVDVNDFNGLYTLSSSTQYDRPIWTVPQSPNDQNIQYYFGTNWIINGIGGGNILSYESNEYLPPINDITAQWTHASLGGIFYVDLHCINSYSPTIAPTESPSPSPTYLPTNAPSTSPTDLPTSGPTQPPTFQPTPKCPTVFVNVSDANGLFNDANFNGLYTYSGNRWEVPQIPNLKNIEYLAGYWSIKGFDHRLSHQSLASTPPYNDLNAEWGHSSVLGIFHVDITCISSFAPIAAPTLSPTLAPTYSPTDIPTNAPTIAPSPSPTNIPTNIPTNAPTTKPTITPTKTPSVAPSNIPSQSPSHSPTISPSHAPTAIPSETPTSAPTAIPSSTPSNAPSLTPTLTPSINPSITPSATPSLSPSTIPTLSPSKTPSNAPTNAPSLTPTSSPTNIPSLNPSTSPTLTPSIAPTKTPSDTPTVPPSQTPTSPPTITPSGSPTQPPTNAPIPQCPTITVNILNATHLFAVDNFNGLYTNIENPTNGYRRWIVPQSPTDKLITHIGNDWVIEGYGDDKLSTASNENFPPENATWTHSANTNWNIQVDVVCGVSFAPITAPTAAPSAPPTNAPSYSPSTAPTRSPSIAPSIAPSYNPSTAPTIAPSIAPSLAPSNAPSNNPSIAPSIAPTAAPSVAPSIAPTVPPTNNPSIAPTKVPSGAPSMNPTLTPSRSPSVSPSVAPSLSPSITPTQPPSTAPSNDPSVAPSNDPTLAPSNNPTASPSHGPTLAPTIAPTFPPTVTPTLSPTIAPTLAPTSIPTNAPSTSPTACIDYPMVNNTKFNSMDGMDRVYTANITRQVQDLKNEISQETSTKVDKYETKYETYSNGIELRFDFKKESIECDNRRREICFIGCYFETFCEETQVEPNNDNIKQLAVICSQRQACLSMNIWMIDTNINDFMLICDNKLSCESVNITVLSDININMTIICGNELSCSEMTINLNPNNEYNNMWYLDITCNEITACNDMHINTNYKKNIDITMRMYQHSKNIIIAHPKYENLHFICSAPNETHFIRYNTEKDLSDSEIVQLSQLEYGGELPCDGITVDCTENNKQKSKECLMEYNFTSLDHFNIRVDAINNDISCYWLSVDQLYSIRCKGECDVYDDALTNSDTKISDGILASIIIFCLLLSAMIFVMLVKLFKKRKYNQEQLQAMPMQNPMVIVIGIGHYDEQQERTTEFENLNVQIDIRNLLRLFNHKKLNYAVFPEYDKRNPQIRWTYKELSTFLKKQAKILEGNLEQKQEEQEEREEEKQDEDNIGVYFDGLIVIISCHGMKGCIITSDYKRFNKKNLQLMFTAKYPLSRNIPRFFLYDCCDGSNFKTKGIKKKKKSQTGVSTSIKLTTDDQGKNESLRQNHSLINDTKKVLNNDEWHNENNKLGVIHAANPGFQANMNNEIGSYVIALFEEKISKGLRKRKDYFLYQIFDEIQNELTKAKKQLPTFKQHDHRVRYVQFKKNASKTSELFIVEIEDVVSSGSEGEDYRTEDEREGYNEKLDDLKEEENDDDKPEEESQGIELQEVSRQKD